MTSKGKFTAAPAARPAVKLPPKKKKKPLPKGMMEADQPIRKPFNPLLRQPPRK